MAETTRTSGITVSVAGPVELAEKTAIPKRSTQAPLKRTGEKPPHERRLILEALAGQDLELVDSIAFAIPLSARPKKRGAIAPSSRVTLDVPLGADEQAVILLEDEGEYRWVVDGRPGPAAGPKRGRSATKRRMRFSIDLKAAPSPAMAAKRRGGAKRSWLVERLVGVVTAYVFRFTLKLAGKKIVDFLERKIGRGLVAITRPDPQKWQLLDDSAALPVVLPAARPARILLLVHGTFSSTVGSFGALGVMPKGIDFLTRALDEYDAVLGFDHPTLSVDPLENARSLLARLRKVKWGRPPRIDILAFSRGGLVARSLIEQLLPGTRRGATIGPVVFVGCTNGGTQLAGPKASHGKPAQPPRRYRTKSRVLATPAFPWPAHC